ncbi:MAG: DUF4344 domain-containing metallopeptidase [Gammaproteobacteria bacterium]
MKTVLAFAVTGIILITAMAIPAFAASKTNRISVRYVPPKNPAHQEIYTELKQRGSLEKIQRLLSPVRLPRTLRFSLEGCDGEADAFYEEDEITICYEYVAELVKNKPQETTPGGVEPIDTIIGPMFEVTLHEFAHALFDMLKLPVFGREEDAADQVAAYTLLQFGEAESRRLIAGTAYAYHMDDQKIDHCRSMEDYADEHGTPAQRFFNVLCIAYGADTKLFGDIVRKGFLPKSRAEWCEEEYEQVQDAVDLLIVPHIDLDLADQLMEDPWLREPEDIDLQ